MGNFIFGLIVGALIVLCIWKKDNVKLLISKIKEKISGKTEG